MSFTFSRVKPFLSCGAQETIAHAGSKIPLHTNTHAQKKKNKGKNKQTDNLPHTHARELVNGNEQVCTLGSIYLSHLLIPRMTEVDMASSPGTAGGPSTSSRGP